MTSDGANTDGELIGTGAEQNQHRALTLTCPCQHPTDSQAKYCCSIDGSTCGLGLDRGYGGIAVIGGVITAVSDGVDGMGNGCGGRCDLQYPCQASGDCCSFSGFCGSTSDYCSNQMAACNDQALAPGFCGSGARGSGRCKSAAHCCSAYGWCDTPGNPTYSDHCATPTTGQTVWKNGSYKTETYTNGHTYCGNGTVGNGHCLGDNTYNVREGLLCCSQSGFCGNAGCDPYGYPFCATSPASTCPKCPTNYTYIASSNSCVAANGPTPTPTASQCGSCTGCYYPPSTVCAINWTQSQCASSPGYIWCASSTSP